MRSMRGRRAAIRGAVTALGTGLWIAASSGPAPPAAVAVRPLVAIEGDLAAELEEGPVQVRASRALCAPVQAMSPAGPEQVTANWYWGDDGCKMTALPHTAELVTPMTEGAGRKLLESPGRLTHLNALLDELERAVAASKCSPLEKLIVHSMAWEVTFGVRSSLENQTERAEGDPTVRRALHLLDGTRFSAEDLGALPGDLGDLPAAANAPQIAATVLGLLRHDPQFFEVVPPSDFHAEMLLGRFTPRIFLTADSPVERDHLRARLEEPGANLRELANLPQSVAGLRAILVLYFNVFREDDSIAPTDVVAFWKEYWFTEKTRLDLPIAEAARRIQFFIVDGMRDPGGKGLRYEVANLHRMARRTEPDVKPTIPTEATTLEAHCFNCHRNRVSTLYTIVPRRVQWTRPLARPVREVLTPFYHLYEARLRKWKAEYAAAAGGHPRPPEATEVP
jgi:hypothetical protein